MEHVKRSEIFIDRLRTLHVHDGRDDTLGEAILDVLRRAADPEPAE